MQDQHFIREWTERHAQFSADIDSGLGQLSQAIGHRRESRKDIGGSYGFLDKYAPSEPAAPVLSPAASASLRGLAASVITFALWVSVMLVATPAPGLASTALAPAPEAGACLAAPILA
jgi:hypothetical protein